MPRFASPPALTLVVCAAQVIGMAGFAAFPALMPGLIDTWALSNTDAGWINGIFYAGYLSGVPILTSLTDRLAPRRIYYLSLGLSALSGLAFGLVAEGFWSALALRLVAGLGLAGTYMPGLKLLSDHIEGYRYQPRCIAFYTSTFGLGVSLSFLLSGEIAGLLGWRWAFGLTAAGPVVALVLLVLLLPARDPRPHAAPKTHLLDFRPVLRTRAAMGYVLAYAAHNFELFAMRSWLVAYLVFAQGLGPGREVWSATVIATLVNLVGMPASVLGNELAVRFGRRRLITLVMAASAVVAALVGLAAAWPFWLLVLLCLVYAATILGDSASITAGLIGVAPKGYRGATMAVYSSIGFAGSFAGPLVFGVLLDLAGGGGRMAWAASFTAMGLVGLSGALALSVLGRQGSQPRPGVSG